MGANIRIHNHDAHIHGGTCFHGAQVNATDLRAGAAINFSRLNCSGTTYISHIHHIDRGYENIEKQLQSIGANVTRIED